MKSLRPILLLLITLGCCLTACNHFEAAEKVNETNIIHENLDQLNQVIIYDGFTPPVAARIYAYTALASYEALRFKDPNDLSITAQLKKFGKGPVPFSRKKYDFSLAATRAYFLVAERLTFSVDTLKKYEGKIYLKYKGYLDGDVYDRSMQFGSEVAQYILKRSKSDNYTSTRAAPRFLGNSEPGQWHPTPPDYLDGVEVFWDKLVTLGVDSSAQFPPPAPPPYSDAPQSSYVKQIREVYQANRSLSTEQKQIARFWDDNPFVMAHKGHLTYAEKKLTPGGHWMGITSIACKKRRLGSLESAQAYAVASIAIYDGFICSWYLKYKYNTARPVNEVNRLIDKDWLPFLQTPPYPDYTAGHPTLSKATAVVLTRIFGDNFTFVDTTEMKYLGIKRRFTSFSQASDETTISRFYGGIHYRSTVEISSLQGKKIGEYILDHIQLKNK